jgi:Leucine-rich repeat (LRR) protein
VNQLVSLPKTKQNCKNLELVRLFANKLTHILHWLLELPKLSWLAFSGNDCFVQFDVGLDKVSLNTLQIQEELGEGASILIYKAFCTVFKKRCSS